MGRNSRAVVLNVNTRGEAVTYAVQRQLKGGSGTQDDLATFWPQRLQRVAYDIQQNLFDLVRVMRKFRQARIVIADQFDVIRQFHRDQLHNPFGDLMDAFGHVHPWMLRPQQAVDQIS